ncbi:MAG: N-acetylmuramoyl-L-alanine amidase [Actinomycetota bacterium]
MVTGRRATRRLAPGLVALTLVAAACGGDAAETAEDTGGVRTVDAGEAARARAELGLGPADDPDGPTGADEAGGESAVQSGSGDAAGIGVTPSTYPEISVPIADPEPGTRALITPTGVLVGVVGVIDDGTVVETPCGGVTIVSAGQSVGEVDVVIDPGHGGDEAGAIDPVSGLTEAELNLSVARRARDLLVERSIATVLIRDADYRIPIRRRAELADGLAPRVFVSIHHNTPASRPSPTPGTEVYVQNGSEDSRRLGGVLYESVVEALSQFEDVEWTARDDAGVLVVLNDEGEDSYGIARYPITTSALLELAYLGNESEAALMQTPAYIEASAAAVAEGIERYLTTGDEGTGYVDQPRIFNPSGLTGGVDGCIDPLLE